MLHKEFNNELRAYPTHQAVQTIGSTAVSKASARLREEMKRNKELLERVGNLVSQFKT